MAPPRAPRIMNSQPARETRNSVAGTKTSRGGGIQKRRGGRTQVDRDGDLDMGSAVGGNGTRRPNNRAASADTNNSRPQRPTRGGGPPTKPGSKVHQAIARHLDTGDGNDLVSRRKPQSSGLVWLTVKGLKESKAASNDDGGLRDLLMFLERKATTLSGRNKTVHIKKSSMRGDLVNVAASQEDAEEILKVNTFTFAGTQLEITDSDGSIAKANEASAAAQETKQKLQSIMSLRYDMENKLLRLDSLYQDEGLIQMGILESKDRAEKLFKVMMRICDELFKTAQAKIDAIHSISLANNNIDTVAQVEEMADTFPDLKNLDLSGNQIASVTGLSRWRQKLKKLETLYLTGNPLNIADPKVVLELLHFFPKLQVLNGEQLTPERIAEIKAAGRPKPIPQRGPDFRDVAGIGEAFLLEFFLGFDTDRTGLLAKYYDDNSQFSLAVDTYSIRDPSLPQPMPWASYIKQSRNLMKITTPAARAARLITGREAIWNLWNDLPKTQHPDIKVDISKYIMDCHLLPGLADPTGQTPGGVDGMIISVHGQFEECDKDGKTGLRSFSRTFVLGPGRPNSNPIRVVSDMLSLRAFNPLPNVFVAEAQAPPAQEQEQRQAMIVELSKQTTMTHAYSEMCLSDVAWDFTRALAVFHEKKAQLPAEAFVSV
ncbi:TAP domain-containing protein [Colletotrichum graminicola M1.001]|uniref:mRNA export factor MEX67 n=1 Tax=Colletotrichum graminicola (strain M1.001 / M2 / FGSC 10212) TaxID=645133 RepID=E3QES6_COLGM|nr:TAP domain-containing protein [Colletotrichum graminicola M1.001]EFQ29382.1 TAP domain-containing protein [Colletotrichum graminicola M1.001]